MIFWILAVVLLSGFIAIVPAILRVRDEFRTTVDAFKRNGTSLRSATADLLGTCNQLRMRVPRKK